MLSAFDCGMTPLRRIRFLALLALGSGCGDSGFDPDTQLARIVLSTGDATLQPGETIQLTATPQDASGAVVPGVTLSWSSTNPQAAQVSGSGTVEALGIGDATIRVTGDD